MFNTSGLVFRIIGAIIVLGLVAHGTFAASLKVKTDNYAAPGWYTTITVAVDSLETEISAFDLTLAIDESIYGLVNAEPGQFMIDCGWEYFSYRRIRADSLPLLDLEGRTDLLNVTGIAAITPGYTVACFSGDNSLELFTVKTLIDYESRGASIRCQAFPIQFFWRDCGDNILVTRYGDTVLAAEAVYDGADNELIDVSFPGYGAPDEPCPNPPGQVLVHSPILTNGSLDLPCNDSVYVLRGDINLNRRPYEAADVVLYMCVFLRGIACFNIDVDEQIKQTDVNNDGMTLTVADLVLLIRIILDDARPAKPSSGTFEAVAQLQSSEGTMRLTLDVNDDVGAVYLRAVGPPGSRLRRSDITFPEEPFGAGQIDDTVTMLLVDIENGEPVLGPGRHVLLESSTQDLQLAEIVVVDTYGREVSVSWKGTSLPEGAVLSQSYPNPFNASTVIQFYLPTTTDWKLTVYNALGQSMRDYSGADNGLVTVEWNGLNPSGRVASSGVYFYRLETATGSQTKKMLLLK